MPVARSSAVKTMSEQEMPLDKIFGIHAQAIQVRAQRTEVLATNLANSETPGYKARDIDFLSILRSAAANDDAGSLRRTNSRHITLDGQSGGAVELQYRNPNQPSLDQNTVDTQIEQSEFMENALRYQASMRFLNGRISGLQSALRGD